MTSNIIESNLKKVCLFQEFFPVSKTVKKIPWYKLNTRLLIMNSYWKCWSTIESLGRKVEYIKGDPFPFSPGVRGLLLLLWYLSDNGFPILKCIHCLLKRSSSFNGNLNMVNNWQLAKTKNTSVGLAWQEYLTSEGSLYAFISGQCTAKV